MQSEWSLTGTPLPALVCIGKKQKRKEDDVKGRREVDKRIEGYHAELWVILRVKERITARVTSPFPLLTRISPSLGPAEQRRCGEQPVCPSVEPKDHRIRDQYSARHAELARVRPAKCFCGFCFFRFFAGFLDVPRSKLEA